MEKFQRVLPDPVYAKFESITLKFMATPDVKDINFHGSGLWKDGDVKEVDYLAGIQMMTRQNPLNFSQVGLPKKARFGIGNLQYQMPELLASEFAKAHREFCGAWLELEDFWSQLSVPGPSLPSRAFCIYSPEKARDPMDKATYNDWRHLRDEVILGLESAVMIRSFLEGKRAIVQEEKAYCKVVSRSEEIELDRSGYESLLDKRSKYDLIIDGIAMKCLVRRNNRSWTEDVLTQTDFRLIIRYSSDREFIEPSVALSHRFHSQDSAIQAFARMRAKIDAKSGGRGIPLFKLKRKTQYSPRAYMFDPPAKFRYCIISPLSN